MVNTRTRFLKFILRIAFQSNTDSQSTRRGTKGKRN